MKDVLLHIGQSKTGTTSIQRMLAGREEALHAAGVLYPRSGRQGEAHHAIASQFRAVAAAPDWTTSVAPDQFILDLGQEMNREGFSRAVLSSELFFDGVGIRRIAGLFSNYRVRIVLVLRRQDHWLESLYQHQLKALKTSERPDVWLLRRLESQTVAYDRRVERWENAFGREAIRLGTFEQAEAHGGVERQFCSLAELPLNLDETAPALNARLSRDCVAAMQWLHYSAGFERAAVRSLRRDLEQYSSANSDPAVWRNIFSPALRRLVLERCAEYNAGLEARYPAVQWSVEGRAESDFPFEAYPGLFGERLERLIAFLSDRNIDRQMLLALREHCGRKAAS